MYIKCITNGVTNKTYVLNYLAFHPIVILNTVKKWQKICQNLFDVFTASAKRGVCNGPSCFYPYAIAYYEVLFSSVKGILLLWKCGALAIYLQIPKSIIWFDDPSCWLYVLLLPLISFYLSIQCFSYYNTV